MDKLELAHQLGKLSREEYLLVTAVANAINGWEKPEKRVFSGTPAKKRPGRPKGSKNKPKSPPPHEVQFNQDEHVHPIPVGDQN